MSNLKEFNAFELTLKHCYLMQEIEDLPAGSNILKVKTEEAKALEEELRTRLYSLLINSVLPILITTPRKAKEIEKKIMIPFHFEVFSSLNTRVDRFKVDASTKKEAWIEAKERAKKYPGDITLKIQ